jgi:hypothetical protein
VKCKGKELFCFKAINYFCIEVTEVRKTSIRIVIIESRCEVWTCQIQNGRSNYSNSIFGIQCNKSSTYILQDILSKLSFNIILQDVSKSIVVSSCMKFSNTSRIFVSSMHSLCPPPQQFFHLDFTAEIFGQKYKLYISSLCKFKSPVTSLFLGPNFWIPSFAIFALGVPAVRNHVLHPYEVKCCYVCS